MKDSDNPNAKQLYVFELNIKDFLDDYRRSFIEYYREWSESRGEVSHDKAVLHLKKKYGKIYSKPIIKRNRGKKT